MELRKSRFSKGKEKDRRKGFWEIFTSKKKTDTIEGHQNKDTIEDQGCSWTTPLKNCLGAVFIIIIIVIGF